MFIGKKIKEIREKQGMKLSALAQRSGVQIATLSRIENLKMIGTLESHLQIARALNIDVTQLYNKMTAPSDKIAPKESGRAPEVIVQNENSSREILATNIFSKQMMPLLLRVDAGGKSKIEQSPSGGEKFIYVLEGSAELKLGNQSFKLIKNSSLYFNSSDPHFFTNTGDKQLKILCVMTPVNL